jgi:hypothetical protein
MDIDSMIAVLEAAKKGKMIQSRLSNTDNSWIDCSFPTWDFCYNEYRVKPEPKEIWVHGQMVLDHKPNSEFPYKLFREVIE